jgi:hypothetical protein
MTDGLVQQATAAVSGASEIQRLTLVGDTSASAPAASAVVSQVQEGGAGQSASYGIVFKAEKVIQEYELFLIDSPAQKVRAVYRGDGAVATTISEMRTAYATLFKSLTNNVVNVANVEVSLDTSYQAKGDRYIVRFVGALAGKALPAAGWAARHRQVPVTPTPHSAPVRRRLKFRKSISRPVELEASV